MLAGNTEKGREREGERRRKKFYFRSQDAKLTQKIHVNCHMTNYLKSYRGGGMEADNKKQNIYILIVIKKEKKKQR